MNRGVAMSWAIGLGLLASSIGAAITPSGTAGEEVRQTGGLFLIFAPALYGFTTHQWSVWRRTNPYVRFAVFHLSFLAAGVLLVRLVVSLLSFADVFADAAMFTAIVVAFVIASWLTFYRGADQIWSALIDRFDIDW